MRPVVSVRPSVSTVFLNSLTFNLDFCMCMSHDHNKPGIESRDRRPRSKVKMCVLDEYLLLRPMSID